MALKFLNKKGWHTGSLRNVETVWKAEQKHEAEQKKLEELKVQIQEEREKSEFRLLQEQAGLVPRQERLDFLYESGLSVGKGSTEVFKALQDPAPVAASSAGTSSSKQSAVLGALFEDTPQSANDAWRKLHTDPLLLIRQREQDALARIKNNPIKMAMIKKSVEAEKKQKEEKKEKKKRKKHRHGKSKHRSDDGSDSEYSSGKEERRKKEHKMLRHEKRSKSSDSEEDTKERTRDHELSRRDRQSNRDRPHASTDKDYSGRKAKHDHDYSTKSDSRSSDRDDRVGKPRHDHDYMKKLDSRSDDRDARDDHEYSRKLDSRSAVRDDRSRDGHDYLRKSDSRRSDKDDREGGARHDNHSRHEEMKDRNIGSENNTRVEQEKRVIHRRGVHKMSEKEREERLQQMQLDAELHEEQRWKRLKKAEDDDAKEAVVSNSYRGKNFLHETQKSIYGAEKGGSSTIEESVRRRAYFSQGGKSAHESNAFRR
ncbi:pre-mRNA-splicing factor CWC25 isoform X1 [Carex littledalei]|uniref:Pre-mRNA-splicing factor CWC25 isoform X1 n=1 Tax=Carex littledalei TaxID=544730 RepID=A0A833R8D4_9POAL|nr:pre-mRNA-splicing factor CWC25 isoform X1 [Carex littledalei]